MFSDTSSISRRRSETSRTSFEKYEITWRGLVYLEGFAAGTESILEFAKAIGSGLAEAAARLKGVFFLVIRDHQSNQYYAFVDNSGLYHAFYSRQCAGASFLGIAGLEELGTADLDPEAVVEFLHFGSIYSGKTFFESVRKIDADDILCFQAEGPIQIISKRLPDISKPVDESLENVLRNLAGSVAKEKVSLDLTGGIDSRLLAVVLSYFGLSFELAGSGLSGNRDLQIAATVAEILGCEFHPTYHDPESSDWEQVFEICDGLFDIAKADRPLQLQRDRVARGVTLAVSGAGGELFKDFWWLQDFPLYSLANPNLKRLFATRIAPADLQHTLFAGQYREISESYRQRLLRTLTGYAADGNTQTYDRIYYGFKMREVAGRFLTNSTKVLRVHAPYLDRTAVRIGYALRRRERFFNRYHRRIISQYCPAAARTPTTEGGMSVSSEPTAVLSDLGKYVRDRATRIAQKVGQRLSGKMYWQESADHPKTKQILRLLATERRSVERLQDHGVLDPGVRISELPTAYLGTVISLEMLFTRIESNRWTLENNRRDPAAA